MLTVCSLSTGLKLQQLSIYIERPCPVTFRWAAIDRKQARLVPKHHFDATLSTDTCQMTQALLFTCHKKHACMSQVTYRRCRAIATAKHHLNTTAAMPVGCASSCQQRPAVPIIRWTCGATCTSKKSPSFTMLLSQTGEPCSLHVVGVRSSEEAPGSAQDIRMCPHLAPEFSASHRCRVVIFPLFHSTMATDLTLRSMSTSVHLCVVRKCRGRTSIMIGSIWALCNKML
jgi:hypothetical protein